MIKYIDNMFKYADFEEARIKEIIGLNKEWEDNSIGEIKRFKSELYSKLQENERCPYCRRPLKRTKEDEIDHIIYKADYKNFMFQPQNLVLSCHRCNNKKLNKNVLLDEYIENVKELKWNEYPMESKYYKIVHPYIDNYYDYIEINAGIFYRVINGSPKGSNTIEMMGLKKLDFVEETVKTSASFGGYISSYINDRSKDEPLVKLAEFLLTPLSLRNLMFDIFIAFERSSADGQKIDKNNYDKIKAAILRKDKISIIPICSARYNFIKKVNNLTDVNIINQLIELFEQLYALSCFNEEFESSLYLATILLVRREEGSYSASNVRKYFTS